MCRWGEGPRDGGHCLYHLWYDTPLLFLVTGVLIPSVHQLTPLVWLFPLPRIPTFLSAKWKPSFQAKIKEHILFGPFSPSRWDLFSLIPMYYCPITMEMLFQVGLTMPISQVSVRLGEVANASQAVSGRARLSTRVLAPQRLPPPRPRAVWR